MTDALSQAADAVAPTVEPYEPFPSFEQWLGSPFDGSGVDRFIDQLRLLKAGTEQAALDDAVAIATRWAAVNTGAIEGLYEVDRGFTYSVAVSAAAWQEISSIKGQEVADSIADAVRAYELVLDAANQRYPVTQMWIRSLHEVVVASQATYAVLTGVGSQEQALPKGEYKHYPNNPLNFASRTIHSYASPAETPAEMVRFVGELASPTFESAHPILQAAYAHYAFVCVHPFADGNGRVARALASTYLYRGTGVPLVVFADQKGDYLDCLELADSGQPERFARFVGDRVSDTIGMVREQIQAASVPDVSTQMADLAPLLTGLGGLAHEEIDALVQRLRETFLAALEKQIAETPLTPPLKAAVQQTFASPRIPAGYRIIPNDETQVQLVIRGQAPALVALSREYFTVTRRPDHSGPDFAILAEGREILTADLRELHPIVTKALQFRMEVAAQRELRELTREAAIRARVALKKAGYL